jgi:hypothetical protein
MSFSSRSSKWQYALALALPDVGVLAFQQEADETDDGALTDLLALVRCMDVLQKRPVRRKPVPAALDVIALVHMLLQVAERESRHEHRHTRRAEVVLGTVLVEVRTHRRLLRIPADVTVRIDLARFLDGQLVRILTSLKFVTVPWVERQLQDLHALLKENPEKVKPNSAG